MKTSLPKPTVKQFRVALQRKWSRVKRTCVLDCVVVTIVGPNNNNNNNNSNNKKVKVCSYNAVSSPWDCSKRFTLDNNGNNNDALVMWSPVN